MKVLYVFSSFCVIIVASGRPKVQVTVDGSIENCPDFKNTRLILSDLKFTQKSSDEFTLNGKYTIQETIDRPITIKLTSKKYERGTWVNSMLNQNINDVCKEMEKEKRPEWLKLFDNWTIDKRCPFIKKEGEYNEFVIFNSTKSTEALPPNFYGKYKSEARFYRTVNGDMVQFACFLVGFELANV